MLIRKCDVCKKEIKKGDQEIVVMMGWHQFSFCAGCGRPILAFLRKRKLLTVAASQ
jgi:hypothetical protein